MHVHVCRKDDIFRQRWLNHSGVGGGICCLECKFIAYIVDCLRWAILPPLFWDPHITAWWGLSLQISIQMYDTVLEKKANSDYVALFFFCFRASLAWLLRRMILLTIVIRSWKYRNTSIYPLLVFVWNTRNKCQWQGKNEVNIYKQQD